MNDMNIQDFHKGFASAFTSLENMDFHIAMERFREVLDFHKKTGILSEDEELIALEGLGISLLADGDKSGVRYIEEVHNRVKRENGENDLLSLLTLRSLGEAYLASEQNEEALQIFKTEYSIRQSLDPFDIETVKAGLLYATSLRHREKYALAISIHIDNLEKIEEIKGECTIVIDELIELGLCYIALDIYSQALEIFNLAYEYAILEFSEYSSYSQSVLLYKIRASSLMGEFNEVISLCDKAIENEAFISDRNEYELHVFRKSVESELIVAKNLYGICGVNR